MSVRITSDLYEIPKKLVSKYYYKVPLHDPYLWLRLSRRSDMQFAIIEDDYEATFTLFKLHHNRPYAECVILGSPFVGEVGNLSVTLFRENLDALSSALHKPLYFPLVYTGDPAEVMLSKVGAAYWKRLPSPIITAKSLSKGLVERATERIGSRARRRIRRFQNSNAEVTQMTKNDSMLCIEYIEKNSWKAELNQDMFSRDQADIYGALAESPNAIIRVATLEGTPISYRFDYRIDSIVYALKWSFSEKHRRLSPGFYLLTQDLSDCWCDKNIDYIDLYGSSDSLKVTICDIGHDRSRIDFAWPSHVQDLQDLRSERLEHDKRLIANAWSGHGTRQLYQ